jgi:hypothetical protein
MQLGARKMNDAYGFVPGGASGGRSSDSKSTGTTLFELVAFENADGPLTKTYCLIDGKPQSDGGGGQMVRGRARRVVFDNLQQFADFIASMKSHEAIALGSLRADLPAMVHVTTERKLKLLNGTSAPDLIARTGSNILYRPGHAGLALIDFDTKGMPAVVREKIEAAGGLVAALLSMVPALAKAGRVVRPSTSAGIRRAGTGETFTGSGNCHIYVLIADGDDADRFLRNLHDRCWLAGFAWKTLSQSGSLLERSLVDRVVGRPERLTFEGPSILTPPLEHDPAGRRPQVYPGPPLDTRAVCLDLTVVQQARIASLKDDERRRIQPEADRVRGAYIEVEAGHIAERTGCTAAEARRRVEQQCGGVLLPSIVPPFDDPALSGTTVGDVLRDPERFLGETLADPIEGVAYGRGKAKILQRRDGMLVVHSFAHGGGNYELRYDAATVEVAVRAAGVNAADRLVEMAPLADLDAEQLNSLVELAAPASRLKVGVLQRRLKAALKRQREQLAEAVREERMPVARDGRLRLPVPTHDAERLPVMRDLDEVLTAVQAAIPPIRDVVGRPIYVEEQSPLGLHLLTSESADDRNVSGVVPVIPAPPQRLLVDHNRYTLAHEIETHVAYEIDEEDEEDEHRIVALPMSFVEHYLRFQDSRLPRVKAIVTSPLVLLDGTVLAPEGLDRERGLLFDIDPALRDALPNRKESTGAASAEALRFLTEEWLCDVATDFDGKCILVAMALSILQRALFSEKPCFFVTAPQRGGGKTTAVAMVGVATTGHRPAAKGWSDSEEERRKAMLATLSTGVAMMVWDNIKRGESISCPTVEKVLTGPTFSDRVLGKSEDKTVSTATIFIFTGNNIGPKGDLASRGLIVRLDVDRPDPENRTFAHSDPIGWTRANTIPIRRALHTILLANPRLAGPLETPDKTRFKDWWRSVGAAIEHAAKQMGEEVDFGRLFAMSDEHDEEAAGVGDVLRHLHTWMPSSENVQQKFTSGMLRNRLIEESDNPPGWVVGLRDYFSAPGRKIGDLSAKRIGHALGKIVGTLVPIGVGSAMALERETDPHEKVHRFWVRVQETSDDDSPV